jgi:FkbM family methyltransferase
VRDRLKILVRSALNAVGLDVIPASKGPNFARRRLLERVQPDLIVDVGANTGQHAMGLRAMGYRGDILSLEPMAAPFKLLQARAKRDPHWTCLPYAAGASHTHALINVAANSVSSSLLPMTDTHVNAAPESKIVSKDRIEVVRLDSLAPCHIAPGRKLWLKIDVQGTEADVIEGARGLLDQVHVIDVELSLSEVYRGQRLMPEMMELIGGMGFELMSLQNVLVDRSSGNLLQMDGLFVRRAASA